MGHIALERAAYEELHVETDREFEASASTSITQQDYGSSERRFQEMPISRSGPST
jgi:hypothetical protein